MKNSKYLLSIVAVALAPFCAPASAQSLSLTYQLDGVPQIPRAAGGCVVVSACAEPEALGRYSRQLPGDAAATRDLAARDKTAAPVPRVEQTSIPYLGETPRTTSDSRAPDDPELNVKAERPRVRNDIERRFYDAAQEARFNRNTINALGLEVIVPIQSKVRQSADPDLPQ